MHVQRQTDGDDEEESPSVSEVSHRQRSHWNRREDFPPRSRRAAGEIRAADRPFPVLEFNRRYSWMRVGRAVAEKGPGDEPNAADRTKHVEGGRPAAGETVVA